MHLHHGNHRRAYFLHATKYCGKHWRERNQQFKRDWVKLTLLVDNNEQYVLLLLLLLLLHLPLLLLLLHNRGFCWWMWVWPMKDANVVFACFWFHTSKMDMRTHIWNSNHIQHQTNSNNQQSLIWDYCEVWTTSTWPGSTSCSTWVRATPPGTTPTSSPRCSTTCPQSAGETVNTNNILRISYLEDIY